MVHFVVQDTQSNKINAGERCSEVGSNMTGIFSGQAGLHTRTTVHRRVGTILFVDVSTKIVGHSRENSVLLGMQMPFRNGVSAFLKVSQAHVGFATAMGPQ